MNQMEAMERLGEMLGAATEKTSPSCHPEAAKERLREALKRFNGENPFKVGDFVHPRKDAGHKGRGFPHIVLATFTRKPWDEANMNAGEATEAMGVDMIVAMITPSDHIAPYPVGSWMYEPWDDADAA